jgi:tetratricopeptide (TPR) repeat protein
MYSEEVKDKILHLLKYKTIKEIAEEFGISYSTLYRWQKTKNDSKLIKELMLEEKYDEALVIGKSYPNNEVIKGQVMSIYMKKRDYEKAIQIAREFPNNASIQSQLMTVYMKNKDYEAAIKIAREFPNNAPIQSQLMTVYVKNKNYGSARKIAAKFPNDNIIQSQLMTAYVKNGDYEGAREIAAKFPNDNIIQSQLMTVYMENKNYESAREIAEKFPNDNIIQSQLMTVYMENGDYESARKIAAKFLNDNIIKRQLMKIHMENEIKESPEEISDWYNEIIKTKKQEFPIKILEIRNKIVVDNISVKDLDTLESFKEKLEEEKYLLIKLAMYEKLGLLNLGMKQLKQNTIFSDKLKKQLLMQFERKSKFYNLGNWDSLIGWFDETKPLEKVQEACVKENDVASGNPSTSIPEVQSKNIKPSSIQKTIPKKQNNPKSIFKTNIGVTNTVPSKVKEEQKKPTKIKNNQGPKTLYDTLDQTYKKMILNLKIKYYKDMHDEEKKQSALYKYDRLEESLSSKPSIKNFDILLLMLIGDGDGSLDIEQSIPKEYNGEYKKVLNKINSRRKH